MSVDTTEYALRILNDMEYGDYTNGEITSEWDEKREIEYIHDYLEFIIGTNGEGEIYEWEKRMAQDTGFKLNEDEDNE